MTRRLWLAIICGGITLSLAVGLRQSFGLFLGPISVDLGFGREVFAFGMAMQNLIWGLATPFAGAIADRFGSGRVAAAGGVLYAAGLMVMSASGDGTDIMVASLLVGLGLGGVGFSVILGAVARAAPPERRSWALGVVSAFGSLGQFMVVPFAQAMLSALGWSGALLLLAALSLTMVGLAAGVAAPASDSTGVSRQTLKAALAEASRHRGFWLLTAGFFVCGFHVVFVATHLPAYLADQALPTWLGAASLSLVGFFNVIGTYVCGLLGGRYPKKTVLSLLYLTRSLVFLVFIMVPLSEISVLVFAAALGLLWLGTVPLTSGLVAHFFGPAHMSMLYGIVFVSHQVGSFFGAWLGGYAFDLTGSYDSMWWLSVALGLVSALLHWPIVERPVARLAGAPAQ